MLPIQKVIVKPVPVSKRDTLAYTKQGEYGEISNCKNPNGCDYIRINYLEFSKKPVLNDTIKQMVLDHISAEHYVEGDLKNFKTDLKKLTKSYRDQKDSSLAGQQPEYYELHMYIASEDLALLVLDFSQAMSGGAHPNSRDDFINWDIKANKLVSLDDILVDNYAARLNRIAERIYRENENIPKNEPLDTYFFPDGFFLNDNFELKPEGIIFFYNTYEIKPYMAGDTELLIPYTSIKKLLRPNTVISQYIK